MRAGLYDQRITIQRKSITYSPSGVPGESWSSLGQRWAQVAPASGDERNAAQQWIAREQTKFVIRWSIELDDLSPLDQIVYPADDAADSPVPARSTYDIISVLAEGRNDRFNILAARRTR